MAKKHQHILPLGRGWAVVTEGRKRFSLLASRQKDAIEFAHRVALKNKADLVIYDKKGLVRRRYTPA